RSGRHVNSTSAANRLAKLVPRPTGAPHVRYLLRARLRLTLWYVGVLFVLLIAIGVTVYVALARVRLGQIDTDLRVAAPAIDRDVLVRQNCNASPSGGGAGSTIFDPDTFILLYDRYGPLYCNPLHLDTSPFIEEALLAPARAGRVDIRTVTTSGVPLRLLTGP